jgi:hypothetical protein
MKRWHALYFALALLVVVNVLIGDERNAGPLAAAQSSGDVRHVVATPREEPQAQKARLAALSDWDEPEEDMTGEPLPDNAFEIADYSAAPAVSEGPAPRIVAASGAVAPPLTVAGTPTPRERKELIES